MSTSKEKHKLTVGIFAAVFQKLMKCKPQEFETEIDENQWSAKVWYKGQAYIVDTIESMTGTVKDMLTDDGFAQHIHPYLWHRAVKGILSNPDFFFKLVRRLDNQAEATILDLTLNISLKSPDKDKIFWELLQQLDKGLLYGKAVVCATSCYDIDDISADVVHRRIINGDHEYNQIVGGLFTSMLFRIGTERDKRFFIYTPVE